MLMELRRRDKMVNKINNGTVPFDGTAQRRSVRSGKNLFPLQLASEMLRQCAAAISGVSLSEQDKQYPKNAPSNKLPFI
ncbi:hypothetical protein ACVNHC_00380 [Pannonibacter sp. Q-1]